MIVSAEQLVSGWMNLNTLPVPDAMYSTAPSTIVPCTVHVHISLHGNIGKVQP